MLKARSQPAPFEVDSAGVARVKGTRFPIEGILLNWLNGESPEVIAQSFYPLDLEMVYGIVAYYLAHRDELDAYLAELEEFGEKLRLQLAEAGMLGPSSDELRERKATNVASVSR